MSQEELERLKHYLPKNLEDLNISQLVDFAIILDKQMIQILLELERRTK